jgi:N-acetylmuramoyl-L-alanine amidase
MPNPLAKGNLIIGGQVFQIDAPVVNWHENGWDATSEMCLPTKDLPDPSAPGKCTSGGPGKQIPYGKLPLGAYTRRFSTRPALRNSKWNGGMNAPYEAAKSVIRKFVIHHDGCASADMCFTVLQDERGLSCHFLVDNDGTIYQTLDLALMGYHASEWNTDSIGVELCCRGDAKKEPTYYSRKGVDRPVAKCTINNHTILSYDYTKEQYDAMYQLSRALLRLLPNLPAEYPQSSPGVQTWDTMPASATFPFAGYIGHYHLTDQKWDPGPFDFKDYCSKIRGAFCFPVFPKGAPEKGEDKPIVPHETTELRAATSKLYALNESQADGGFFPVGPWGEARLWHGGVHLAGKEPNLPVFAAFPGRLVAARMGASSTPVGSANFALIRHQMALGTRKIEFYSLSMHLAEELGAAKPVDWIAKLKDKKLKSGQVTLLDEPIEAGAQIGRIGLAGPGDLSRPQIHAEIFSISDLFEGLPGNNPWVVVDGTGGGRFSDAKEVNEPIDTNKDGVLSKDELKSYYAGGGAETAHWLVTRHVSEWTGDPSWSEALRLPKDFRKLKPREIDQLVAEQITPGLWWTEEVAAHCKLPPDGVVYHYHPISFISWFNQQLVDAASSAAAAGKPTGDAQEVPPGITDDFGDKEGKSMRSANEFVEDPCNEKLTLKEMVMGFEAPECGP